MKAIIDGKRYDTDTAELIFTWDNGHYTSDFGYREKSLYRTNKGKYFILHSGGAMTDMGVRAPGGGTSGSKTIVPVSDFDAFGFLCSHDGEEDAEKLFPAMIEDA